MEGRVNWEIAMAKDSITIDAGQAAESKALFGMTPEDLRAVVEALGQRKYRAVQLGEALYKQRVQSLDEVTTLPVDASRAARRRGLRGGVASDRAGGALR